MSARSIPWLVAALLVGPTTAGANPSVRVEVDTLFAPAGVAYEAWTPFVATVCAPGGTYLLELSAAPNWGAEPQRATRTVRVPEGGCSRTITELYVQGSVIRATVRDRDGEKLASARWKWQGGRRAYSLAVLGDGVAEQVRWLSSDAQVIRPSQLPDRTLDWMPADAVLATAGEIEAMLPAQRNALLGWVDIGGRLLIARDPEENHATACSHGFNPPAQDLWCMGMLLDGADEITRGLGRLVFLNGGLDYQAGRIATTLRERRQDGGPRPLWGPAMSESWTFLYAPAREAIDWNMRSRPPVGLVAGLFAVYVLLLGPIQFRWLSRRGRAGLALWTIPILSVATFLVVVGLGLWLKGGTARYDSVALLEAGSNGRVAASRRYAGLFVDRPGDLEVRGAPDALLREIVEPGPGPAGARIRIDQTEVATLEGIQAGLWETVIVREDSVVDLGGDIGVVRGPDNVEVTNGTGLVLHDAMISSGRPGLRIRLGTLDPGERVQARWGAATYSRLPRGFWLVPQAEAEGTTVLLARLDPRVLPGFHGFARGREHTLLRVVAR